jgi:hypothetical protein
MRRAASWSVSEFEADPDPDTAPSVAAAATAPARSTNILFGGALASEAEISRARLGISPIPPAESTGRLGVDVAFKYVSEILNIEPNVVGLGSGLAKAWVAPARHGKASCTTAGRGEVIRACPQSRGCSRHHDRFDRQRSTL